MDGKAQVKKPSFRIVCDTNGEYLVEVLDKTINFWYITISKLGTGWVGFNAAVSYCKDNFSTATCEPKEEE